MNRLKFFPTLFVILFIVGMNIPLVSHAEVSHLSKSFPFTSLVIVSPYFELSLNQLPGQIAANDGKIDIKPTDVAKV